MVARRIAFIAAAVLVVELAAQLVASRLPPPLEFDNYEQQRQIERMVQEHDGCSGIALAGTSIMGAAGDPQILEAETARTAHNAALGGGGPLILPTWFDEVVLPGICPDTVVIGLGPRDTNDSFVEQEDTVRRYLEARGRPHLVGTAGTMQRLDRWLSRNVGFFKLRSAYRQPATALAFGTVGRGNWRETSGPDGRITIFDDVVYEPDDAREARIGETSMRAYASGGRNLDAVGVLIRRLQDEGIEVVLVDMPRVERAMERIIGADALEQYEADLRVVSADNDVPLLQADDVVVADELFADEVHVNRVGATQFSTWLAEQLTTVDR